MKLKEFLNKLNYALNSKTLYVYGCFGAPMNETNKVRYCNNNDFNRSPDRQAMIKSATDDTFGFDCVCLIKGILWGWTGNKDMRYGGASYCSNGVPDVGANTMCSRYLLKVSSDFSTIQVGEAVWMDGHIGVYIGDGKVIECTPKWDNCVQLSYLKNLGYNEGKCRKWLKHGFIPWVEYEEVTNDKTNEEIIWEYLMKVFNNPYGVAGLMGNIQAESAFIPNNLQNRYNKEFGMTDEEFTNAVDAGTFDFGKKGSFGYGLCQWTYYTRRQNLLAYARQKNVSIGDMQMQLEYLIWELKGYKLYDGLRLAKSVEEASDLIVTKFEKPKNYDTEEVKNPRRLKGLAIYDKFVNHTATLAHDKTSVGARTYVVQSGDTLSKIASRYNTTVDKILEDNKPKYLTMTRNYIRVGWELTV